jgi:hypothetical protein
LLAELDRLGVELGVHGGRLRYAGPKELITPELLDRVKAHKAELLGLFAWDEDEAYRLIENAFSYLREQHLKAGKPDYDTAALDHTDDRVDEAYKAEDMSELRKAVQAFTKTRLREFVAVKRGVA